MCYQWMGGSSLGWLHNRGCDLQSMGGCLSKEWLANNGFVVSKLLSNFWDIFPGKTSRISQMVDPFHSEFILDILLQGLAFHGVENWHNGFDGKLLDESGREHHQVAFRHPPPGTSKRKSRFPEARHLSGGPCGKNLNQTDGGDHPILWPDGFPSSTDPLPWTRFRRKELAE